MDIIDKINIPSIHRLTLEYDLDQPDSLYSQPITWDTDHLYFEFWFTDLRPARYLEMWFPSNLIYDQFRINIDIQISNTNVSHTLFSNSQVVIRSPNHWKIECLDTFSSLSPMLVIAGLDRIGYYSDTIYLPDYPSKLRLDVFKLTNPELDLSVLQLI